MTDVLWRNLFGDESGVIGDTDNSAYTILLSTGSDTAFIGSVTIDSLAKVAGFSHRIPVGQLEPISIPPASGSARTDLIVLRYDPAYAGALGPVRLVRIAGTSASVPAYDDAPPGIEDLPLLTVQRTPGQPLSQAVAHRVFPRICPVLSIDSDAPLPLNSPVGTRIRKGTQEYIRTADPGGTPVWTPDDPPVTGRAATAAAPFQSVTGFLALTDTLGFKHYCGYLKNVGGLNGNAIAGQTLLILPPEMRPPATRLFVIPVNSGQLTVHVDFNPDGFVRVARNVPNVTIPDGALWGFDGVHYR